jgi:membrane protein required for colicin V production
VNWVDVTVAAVLVGFAIRGLMRGFLRELLALVGLFLGLWVALLQFVPLGEWLQRQVSLAEPLPFHVAFLAIFFGISLLANIVGFFLQKVAKGLLMGWLDAIVGLGFGAVKGVMILTVLLFLVAYLPLPDGIRAQLRASALVAHLELANPFLERSVQAYKKLGGDRLWEQFRLPGARSPQRLGDGKAADNAFIP